MGARACEREVRGRGEGQQCGQKARERANSNGKRRVKGKGGGGAAGAILYVLPLLSIGNFSITDLPFFNNEFSFFQYRRSCIFNNDTFQQKRIFQVFNNARLKKHTFNIRLKKHIFSIFN